MLDDHRDAAYSAPRIGSTDFFWEREMKSSLHKLALIGAVAIIGAAGTAQADLMVNGGFETMVPTTGTLPDGYGFWRGDMSTIVEAENSINPYEGVCMLRFDHTTRNGASGSVGAELWQIIDVSAYQSLIRSGRGSIEAGAYFNRVNAELADTMFSIGLYSYAGSANTFPSQWNNSELSSAQTTLISDGNVESWERAMLSLVLPEATDFVVLRISATENVFNNTSGQEFAGHYADGATFNIIPAPSALLCLAPLGLMGIGRRRRTA